MAQETQQTYRPEIDGLRAVAVLPVVFFHAGIGPFSGGFAGVDVFFVISGYLITSIIVPDLIKGTFSFSNFYERRARRILPALFFVMAICIPMAWILLLPLDMSSFSEALVGTTLFVSNFVFWNQSGYFDAATQMKPLLHTWSLAVEEQFYIVFPILLLLIRRRPQWITPAICLAAGTSFALAEITSRTATSAAYYLIHTRSWELMIGALVAVTSRQFDDLTAGSPLTRQFFAVVGLSMVAGSFFLLHDTTRYPSAYTLFPTVGAALVILSARQGTLAAKLLSSRPLVTIGLLSYSIYLWHQPIFSFARHHVGASIEPKLASILIFLCVIFSVLTWHYVEKPFRGKKLSTRKVLYSASLGALALLLAGTAGIASRGFAFRLPEVVEWESLGQKIQQQGNVCELKNLDQTGLSYCFFGDLSSGKIVALYGDSHAQALSYSLASQFTQSGLKGVWVRLPNCHPIPSISMNLDKSQLSGCIASFNHLLRFVRENVDDVVVAVRWTFRLYPVKGEIDDLTFNNGEGGEEIEDYRENFASLGGAFVQDGSSKALAVEEFLRSFNATGKRTIVVYPVPELGWNIAKENLRHGPGLEELSTPAKLYFERNRFALRILDGIPESSSFRRVQPFNVLCSAGIEGRCFGQLGGVPLYYDDDHLSERGADLVTSQIMQEIWR